MMKFYSMLGMLLLTAAFLEIHAVPVMASATVAAHETRISLPDVIVRDSHNQAQRLSVLMQDRIAIVNFVFTDCTTVCPLLNTTMQQLQKQLQEKLGKTVVLISISVDPINDTPAKLLDHASKMGAGSHWHWLTGRPSDINRLLRAFGIPVGGRREDHPPVILIGHEPTQRWFRWVGIPSPEILINTVDQFHF